MQVKKLLLEIEPGKDNRAALNRARAAAKFFDADIDVLVCQSPKVVPITGLAEPAVIAAAEEEYLSDVEAWGEAQAAGLVDDGVGVSVSAVRHQPRYEAILAAAEESGADLVIRTIGEQGRLKRLFLGATDWELIRHSKQPLWLVQARQAEEPRRNVLAAVDPTHPRDESMQLDKRLLEFAATLSEMFTGSLHVYHTYDAMPLMAPVPGGAAMTPPAPQIDTAMLERVEALHRSSLDKLVRSYDIADDRVHMLEGDPAANIGDVIDACGIGVVVAGSVSRSWLDRLLIGSTAESLLDAVDCDLVFLKAEP